MLQSSTNDYKGLSRENLLIDLLKAINSDWKEKKKKGKSSEQIVSTYWVLRLQQNIMLKSASADAYLILFDSI